MITCYKSGGCGCYEHLPCNECPASQKEYMLKDRGINIYVAILNGNVKDNYIAIACTEESAKQKIINLYYKDKKHNESDLNNNDIYITIIPFINGQTTTVY